MDIDPKLIPIAIALVALCVPWLYAGTLFTRQRVWKRKFDNHAYEAEKQTRYKAWRGINTVRGECSRLSGAEQQDVRDKAHRSL